MGSWSHIFIHLFRAKEKKDLSLIVDASCAESVERLVRTVDRGTGCDELLGALYKLLSSFPPDELCMRRLSLMQQSLQGEGGTREFCVTTVYGVALDVLNDGYRRSDVSSLPRCNSCPALTLAEATRTSPAAILRGSMARIARL